MTMTVAQGQPSDSPVTPFQGASAPNTIGYRFTELDPGANVYVQRDDVLVVQAISFSSAEILNVNIRLLSPGRPTGRTQPDSKTVDNALGDSPFGVIVPINVMVPSTGISTSFSRVLNLAEGYLMSVAVSATVATQRGQTFVRVFIIRGTANIANVAYLLASDYITTSNTAAWPNGDVRSPLDGAGQLVNFGPGNPAAGLDFGFTLAASTRAQLRCCTAILTTSAAVANRVPSGVISDLSSGRVLGVFPANVAIPASTVARVTFAPGAAGSTAIGTIVNASMPQPTIITSAGQGQTNFSVVTTNIQAGDQWSVIDALFETWFDI